MSIIVHEIDVKAVLDQSGKLGHAFFTVVGNNDIKDLVEIFHHQNIDNFTHTIVVHVNGHVKFVSEPSEPAPTNPMKHMLNDEHWPSIVLRDFNQFLLDNATVYHVKVAADLAQLEVEDLESDITRVTRK